MSIMNNDNQTIGLGLVGCGASLPMYGPIIRFMRKGQFIGCTDIDRDKAENFSKVHGIKKVYKDYEEMLKDPDIKGVVLATPPGVHPDQTVAAAQAGKNVFCEKPMARTMQECKFMNEICRKRGVILMVGHMKRFNKAYALAKKLIDEGALGKVFWIRNQWFDPDPAGFFTNRGYRAEFSSLGGIFQDRVSHTVDLGLWWLCSKPSTVSAHVRAIGKVRSNEDFVSCTVEYENGAVFTFESTTVSYTPWGEEHRIFGTLGTLIIEADRLPSFSTEPPKMTLYRNTRGRGNCEILNVTPYNELMNLDDLQASDNHYLLELEDFAQAIADDRAPKVTGEEAAISIEIANAAYISAAKGRKVSLPLEESMDYEAFFRELVEQPGNRIL